MGYRLVPIGPALPDGLTPRDSSGGSGPHLTYGLPIRGLRSGGLAVRAPHMRCKLTHSPVSIEEVGSDGREMSHHHQVRPPSVPIR
jgi:hypothetical protein